MEFKLPMTRMLSSVFTDSNPDSGRSNEGPSCQMPLFKSNISMAAVRGVFPPMTNRFRPMVDIAP